MASLPPLLSTPVFGVILDAVARSGADAGAIAARHGLAEGAMRLDRAGVFLDDCAAASGDPLFAVRVGLSLPRGTYGAAEFLWRSAPTFREAWQAMRRHQRVVSELFHPSLREAPGGRVQLAYAASPLGRLANEFTVSAGVGLIRELSAGASGVKRIGFAHRAPAERAEIESLLGAAIDHRQADNFIELDAAVLDRPVASADPALFAVLDGLLERLRASLERPDDFVGQVERVVEGLLARGELGIARVARALRMSERTLQRRLEQERTNLRELIDRVRRRRAVELLERGELPLDEVSWRLGFSQFTAFARAYKRWNGETPGAARKRARRPPTP